MWAGRDLNPQSAKRLVYSELTSPMVAPTHDGRMAPPELLHAIYSGFNVRARLSHWLAGARHCFTQIYIGYIAFVPQERRESNSVDEGFGGPPATSASLLWIA